MIHMATDNGLASDFYWNPVAPDLTKIISQQIIIFLKVCSWPMSWSWHLLNLNFPKTDETYCNFPHGDVKLQFSICEMQILELIVLDMETDHLIEEI